MQNVYQSIKSLGLKKIVYIALIGAASLASLVGAGCNEPETVNLTGTVLDEAYMPASAGWNDKDSRYSFSMNTTHGIKSIQVEDYWAFKKGTTNKESIDALIEPGTQVEIQGIKKENLDQQIYPVGADRIKVLE